MELTRSEADQFSAYQAADNEGPVAIAPETLSKTDKAALAKWKKYGYDEQIFLKYPDFCKYLEGTRLLSQMKVTRDTVIEREGQACLLVEGEWTPFSQFKERFEMVDAPRYSEKFLIDRTTRAVYTYLDNGNGFEEHHPYLGRGTNTTTGMGLNPISTLNDADYDRVISKAREFVRPEESGLSEEERNERNESREFVVQIVTSYVKGGNSNVRELLQNRKHPYLRVIVGKDNPALGTKKGQVFEVGYGWKKKTLIPFVASQGQFRSPDVWEYMPCKEKVITNIAITQKEAHTLFRYTEKYHKDSVNLGQDIGFHLAQQNCSVYARMALQSIGIHVPTQIKFKALLGKIIPDWMKAISRGYSSAKACVGMGIRKITSIIPERIRNGCDKVVKAFKKAMSKFWDAIVALALIPTRVAIGDAGGTGGRAFVAPGERPEQIQPRLKNWRSYFELSGFTFNLPGILQEWQRQQPSTIVVKDPVKLAIVG